MQQSKGLQIGTQKRCCIGIALVYQGGTLIGMSTQAHFATNREIDVFYMQRWSTVTESWESGAQFLDLTGAIIEARMSSKLRRIVRFRSSDGRIGRRDDMITVWQGTKVPEWLGDISPA